ncbi:hypothetical protein [Brevibacillus reuszeri]|uniref:hypothetical protein n=1 Tax=Brevibacillus reuszeri TaxID=54915 RepID=UPI003D229B2E
MTDENKVVRIGVTHEQRMRNQKGAGYVPCEVSGRYLMFDSHVTEDGLVHANVRTFNGEDDKKLCDLVLRYEDLVYAINNMKR